MPRPAEIISSVVVLSSEDGDPLLQENGRFLLVGYARSTTRAFSFSAFCDTSDDGAIIDFGDAFSGGIPIIVSGGDSYD
jgi:hypothetical protein